MYEEIVSVLRMNKQREWMVRGSTELSQDAMVVSERSWREMDRHEVAGRQTSPKSIGEVRCYMCWQLGHIKRDCSRRKREKEKISDRSHPVQWLRAMD